MKKITAITIGLLAALCFGGSYAIASPGISLDQTGYTGYIGTVFQVEVWLDADDLTDFELLSFGFDVLVEDESVYHYAGYTLGSDFEYLGFYQEDYVGGMAFPSVTDDEVLLAILYFTIVGEGSCDLDISAEYDGSMYGLFYLMTDTFEEAGYSLSSSVALGSAVPVPGAVWMMGAGLVALAGIRRRNT